MSDFFINQDTFLDMLHFRHACKQFDPSKKISEKDFEFILKAGQLSPSSVGLEPWKILVVQDPAKRELLTPMWGGVNQLPTSSHFVVFLASYGNSILPNGKHFEYMMESVKKYPQETVDRLREMSNSFINNDLEANSPDKIFQWTARQVYLMLNQMMIAAASIKVDSCPIEGFNVKEINSVLEKDFNVNLDEYRVAVMAAFGYRVNDQSTKTRREISEFVEWF